MSRFARHFEPLYERWRLDIRKFALEGLRFGVSKGVPGGMDHQKDLFNLVQVESYLPLEKRKKRIAIKSGKGTGKTAGVGVPALWWLFRNEGAQVVATAPSMKQCRQWLDETRRTVDGADPILRRLFECLTTRIQVFGNDRWCIKLATATRPQNLQGIHAEHLMIIMDEFSGIARPLVDVALTTLTNPDSLIIGIGNPNTTDCAMYDAFTTQRESWHCLTWNAETVAAKYPHILAPSQIRVVAQDYGFDSDQYRVSVLGEFPEQSPNSVMSMDDLQACTRTSLVGCAGIHDVLPTARAISLDYARYGDDESVVCRRVGLAAVKLKAFVKKDPREVTDFAFKEQRDAGWRDEDCWYVPDAGGMGQGVVHSFHEGGKNVVEFLSNASAIDPTQFADAISEAWWSFRALVQERVVHIPDDARLLRQLATRNYYTDRKARIKIETKDEWRKRLCCDESPDRADAVVMAFYPHVGDGVRIHRAEDPGPRRAR
jgi:phage terminase large subunit